MEEIKRLEALLPYKGNFKIEGNGLLFVGYCNILQLRLKPDQSFVMTSRDSILLRRGTFKIDRGRIHFYDQNYKVTEQAMIINDSTLLSINLPFCKDIFEFEKALYLPLPSDFIAR